MASIWKRSQSEYFYACFRGADGRRRKVSTKTNDRREAQRLADRWELESQEELARAGRSVSPAGITDRIQKAHQLAREGRLDPAQVRTLINEVMIAAGREPIHAVSNRSWCDTWRRARVGAVKQRSVWKYEQVCRDWLSFLAARADEPVENLTKDDAVAYREHLQGAGLAARTVNQTIKLLRSIYQEAVEQGHAGRNPFIGIDCLRRDEDAPQRKPFSTEEVAALLSAAEGDWRGLVLVAATTGLRLMDAAKLQWRNVDLNKGVISLRVAKTGKPITLPIHPELQSWLSGQPAAIEAAPVFPTLAARAGTGKSGLSQSFKRLMERAGISAGRTSVRNPGKRGRGTSEKSFHSLRHFAATQLASSGVRAEVARAVTGHTDSEVHAGYVTPDIDALRSAISSIPINARTA